MQVDGSNDVAVLPVLLTFLRRIHNHKVEVQMIIYKPLPTRIYRRRNFHADSYMIAKDLSSKRCIYSCTDGLENTRFFVTS
jgi:hypothetical protein